MDSNGNSSIVKIFVHSSILIRKKVRKLKPLLVILVLNLRLYAQEVRNMVESMKLN